MSVDNKIFPRAFAFAVDDLGWNEGRNMLFDSPPGPYRVGVKRTFSREDYEFIIRVAEAVGVRVQCLFVLSEMDRENVLARYPTTTHMRSNWNNNHRVCDEQLEIMNYVVAKSAYMEFGFHGTGHEFWAKDGVQRRAEWYNMEDRQPWPEEELHGHVKAFKEIMSQYGLTKANGHSFPETFVPCAYSYFWNPLGAYSLGKVMAAEGAKFSNTDFSQIPELNPPRETNGGGFDHGVHVINRMNFGNLWHELDMLPKVTIDLQGTDVIESHWANWLAQDAFLQSDVTARWINYYLHVQQQDDRYIAKNTEQLHSQWLYRRFAKVSETSPGVIMVDNTAMPSDAYRRDLLGNLVLKIKTEKNKTLSEATINGRTVPAFFTQFQYTYLYLPPLHAEKYEVRYALGTREITDCVLNDGTYNVYELSKKDRSLEIDLKVYGTQTIKVRCSGCSAVVSQSDLLTVEGFTYDEQLGIAKISVGASDFQGSRGILHLQG